MNQKDLHIQRVHIENIPREYEFLEQPLLEKEEIKKALDVACKRVKDNLSYFGQGFPTPATKDNVYPVMDNTEWTNGFYTGVLWLAYEYTGDTCFLEAANQHVESFLDRVEKRIELDHHDLGFLYTPSCVAAYKLTGNEHAKKAAFLAADKLMERWQDVGGFLQAWGVLGKKEDYRLIIDCMLNVPLLYWAATEKGEEGDHYRKAAMKHFETSCNSVIRADASAYHTFYFDPTNGEPVKGVTRQGYSDSSSWARGQAWGIYGIGLNYLYTEEANCIPLYRGMTNYFLNRLPSDYVCYWDLIFQDGSGHAKDSSAAAAAVCGMHEMQKHLPEDTPEKKVYEHASHAILRSLIKDYTGQEEKLGTPLLLHGVYSWHSGKGVDEGNIWGDYYYMEALLRMYKNWKLYW